MEVTFQGILRARKVVYRYLTPTPLLEHPLLSRHLGCRVLVKHENHNPAGSFKIRGGLNLLSQLEPAERAAGVIAATRGNHGQSVAMASGIFQTPCTIVVPKGNNPEKNASMEAYGAQLLIHGRDFDEARERVEAIRTERGLRYIHAANEPLLIHGVGTYALEIFQEEPAPDYVFVPLGGGSSLSGVLTVAKAVAAGTRVIGVQAEKAPAVYLSWKQGSRVETDSADTMAGGLATRVPFELTFDLISRLVDDIVTVSEEELEEAVYQLLCTTHNLAEGAGAAATAGAYKLRSQLKGKSVVVVLSGGNISSRSLARILKQRRPKRPQ